MPNNRVDQFVKDPKKALFKLASPVLVAMLVQTLYNIVDTAFVGRVGAEAIAAITFAFPLFFIIIALGSGIGTGMGSRISRFLGAKQKKAAENTAMHGLIISLIIAVIFAVFGFIFIKPMFQLLGAEGIVLEMSIQYFSMILIGSFFMLMVFTINQVLSSEGDTKTPMKIQITGLILNVILDPIFIFLLDWGVFGAGFATMISFAVSFAVGVYYIQRKSYLHIHPSSFKFSTKLTKEIFRIGMPVALTMLLMSFYFVFLNNFVASFSFEHVAALGIVFRLESLAVLPVLAFALSTLTLVGMFSGAKKPDLVKQSTWYGIKINLLIATAVGLILFLFPGIFIRIFTSDQKLIMLASQYIRVSVFALPLTAFGISVARVLQGLGYGLPGLVINSLRVIIIGVPLAYIFIFQLHWSFVSVAYAMIIGGAVSNIVGFFWLRAKLDTKKHHT